MFRTARIAIPAVLLALVGCGGDEVDLGGFQSESNRFVLTPATLDTLDASAVKAAGTIRTGNGGTIDVMYWPADKLAGNETLKIEAKTSLGAPADIAIAMPLSKASSIRDNLVAITATIDDIQAPIAPNQLSFRQLVTAIRRGHAEISVSGDAPLKLPMTAQHYRPVYAENTIGLPTSGGSVGTRINVSATQGSVEVVLDETFNSGYTRYDISLATTKAAAAPTSETLSEGLIFPLNVVGQIGATARFTGTNNLVLGPISLRPQDDPTTNVLLAALASGRAYLVIKATKADNTADYAFLPLQRV